MAIREKLVTAEEFWQIAQLPENEQRRLELEDGVIVEMASSTQENTVTAGRLIHFLNAFVIPNDLGFVTIPDGSYKLGPRRVRQPDVGFISKARHPQLNGVQFPIAPDLAIEVVSPSEDVFKKVTEYIQAGTRLVWTVYTEDKTVYVFQPTDTGELRVQTFGVGDTLDGGDVLPNFRLAVRDIFRGV